MLEVLLFWDVTFYYAWDIFLLECDVLYAWDAFLLGCDVLLCWDVFLLECDVLLCLGRFSSWICRFIMQEVFLFWDVTFYYAWDIFLLECDFCYACDAFLLGSVVLLCLMFFFYGVTFYYAWDAFLLGCDVLLRLRCFSFGMWRYRARYVGANLLDILPPSSGQSN
jgi:hypothetical protein